MQVLDTSELETLNVCSIFHSHFHLQRT